MAVTPAAASLAYTKALAAKSEPGLAMSGEDGANFGKFLSDAISGAIDTAKAGEASMAAGANGQGDIVDIVSAITAAEVTLETVIAIRDRVIAAYQDVMKMPI